MNKKIAVLFAVSSIMLAGIFTVLEVNAYTYYHGYTSTWEDGGYYTEGDGQAYSNGGDMMASTLTYGYAFSYSNCDEVNAVADVDSITATVWWNDAYVFGEYGDGYTFAITLYVNGDSEGFEPAYIYISSNGYAQATFNDLDVDSGDSLDVTISFEAIFYSWVEADFTYVAFTTD